MSIEENFNKKVNFEHNILKQKKSKKKILHILVSTIIVIFGASEKITIELRTFFEIGY